MGRTKGTNVQVNISIPSAWKNELDNLARIYSVEEGKTVTSIGYRLEWDTAFDPAGMPKDLPEGIKSIIGDICDRYQYQVIRIRMEYGHISLCVSCPYTVAPGDTVKTVKSISAVRLVQAYPEIRQFYAKQGRIWKPECTVATVDLTKKN